MTNSNWYTGYKTAPGSLNDKARDGDVEDGDMQNELTDKFWNGLEETPKLLNASWNNSMDMCAEWMDEQQEMNEP
jgi:hypothetical protein